MAVTGHTRAKNAVKKRAVASPKSNRVNLISPKRKRLINESRNIGTETAIVSGNVGRYLATRDEDSKRILVGSDRASKARSKVGNIAANIAANADNGRRSMLFVEIVSCRKTCHAGMRERKIH